MQNHRKQGGLAAVLLLTVIVPALTAQPVASFSHTPAAGVAPLPARFLDHSTGNITTWAWTFGDGATSALQNPLHIYTTVGRYSVSLTVSGPGGSNTLTLPSAIAVSDPPPVAAFTASTTNGVLPLPVTFTDLLAGGPVFNRLWTFGDGATSSLLNPTHTYTVAGTYDVTLTVTGPGGQICHPPNL